MTSKKPSPKNKTISAPNEDAFHLLFEHHPIPMWVYDLKTLAFLEVNDAAVEKYGYTRDEFLTLTIKDIRPAEDATRLLNHLEQKRPALQRSGEWRHHFKNGQIINVEITSHTLKFEGHEAALVMAQDITDRKRAEESLRASEEKYRDLVENSQDLICTHDLQGKLTFVNEAAANISGYSNESLLQMNLRDLLAPKARGLFKVYLNEIQKNGQAHGIMQTKTASGETRYLEFKNTLQTEGPAAPFVHGMARDITERKQVENTLVEKEMKYRGLFENAPDAIFLVDIETGKIIDANPAASRLLRKTREEIIGMNQTEIHPVEDSEESRMLFEAHIRATEGQPVKPIEYSVIRSDGTKVPVEIMAQKVSVDGRQVLQGVFRDIAERKWAEKAVFQEKNFNQAAINSLPGLFYLFDEHGHFLRWNRNFEDVSGYSAKEISHMSPLDFFKGPDKSHIAERIQEVFSTGESTAEGNFVSKDQRQTPYFFTGKIFFLENKSCVLGMGIDITSQKQAEYALRERERQYRTLVEQIPAIVYIDNVGTDIHTLYISPQVESILGFTPGEWRQKSPGIWDALIHPDDLQKVKAKYLLCAQNGEPFEEEYRMKAADGRLLWFHDQAIMLRDENGAPQLVHGVMYDITERKQVEEKFLLQSTALNAAANAIVITNLDGTIEWVNPAFSTLTGYTLEETVGRNPRELVKSGLHDQAFYKNMWDTVLSGEVWHGELTNRRKDGSLYHEEQTITPLENAEGRITHFIAIKQDITARKQAEEIISQRLAEQSILHQVSQSLLSVHLDPETIYTTLHQAVVQIMPCEVFTIILDDKNGGDYHAVYLYDADHRYPAKRVPRGQGLSGKVISNGETLFIHDNLQSNLTAVHFGIPISVRSILAVPLRKNNETVGMVSAQSYQPNAYNERHRVLLETLAAQITTVIENARLFEAERKQRQMSDALRDALSAGASMSVSLDFETILDRLLEAIERVVPFEGGSIMLVQPEKQKVSIAKMRGYKILGKQLVDRISKFSFDIASVENLRWILNNKQPLVISDVKQYPGWVLVPESSFIRSWAGAPIIINNEVIALFSLDSTEPNFFTNEHVELLRAFTGQASLALQNAHLFDETARRAQEFASLYETSSALSAETELNTMLQVIVEHAKKLLGSASSGMYLYLSEADELELTVDTTYIPLGIRLRLGEGMAGRIAQTHQPLRIDDYSTWEGRSPVYEDTTIHAVLEVPMLYGGELIGVLTANEIGDSERKFTEADERMLSLFASQAAGAIHSARLREQTARRLDQLQALHLIDRAISSSFDLRPILNTVISQTIAQLGVDAAAVLLFHPHLQTLEYVAGQGFHTRAIEQTHLRLGECFAGRAAFERRTIHVPNLPDTGSNFARASILEGEGFLEYFAVPLIAKGEIKGVLEVFHRSSLPRNPEWLDFLETLAGQAAITIDQTQLFDDLQRVNMELIIAYDATIEGWSHAMDLRDKETEGHTLRVTEMTMALAKAMGFSEKEMLHIRRGALLHDIGKMGIPDNILHKEGKLTEEEWAIMRQHPTFSYEMLKPIKYLRQSLDIPYCHHEKWNGTGYPRGLKGEQIPLVARIFAVIDVWDAVTIDRPYRKAWTKQKALKYIREQSGKYFEPRVVKAFLKLFDIKTTGPSRKSTPSKKPLTTHRLPSS